jgi:hypothetical protein
LSEFYISEKAIARRTALLLDIARELMDSGTLPTHRIILRQARIRLLTEGYFLLNKAYKDWRLPEGHSNEKIRIAALQAIVIVRFQPFVPIDPTDARDLTEARCNEIFALVYALVMIEARVALGAPEKTDFWLRILDILADASVETLEPFIADINRGMMRPLGDYTLVIHRHDRLAINSLISIFELIASMRDPLLR